MADMTTLRVGAARVTILNAGDLRLKLKDEMSVPEAEWRPQYADLFDQPGDFPSQSIYVEHQGAKVLIDVNDYQATVPPDDPSAIPGYTPPPPIPTQLAGLGVWPQDIAHVVITHAHWDHFAGTTSPASSGGYEPTFPAATYYLGAADWLEPEMQVALGKMTSLEGRTLRVLRERGVLQLLDRSKQLAPGIDILPAPGETKGHQIVRVHSEGETAYMVGDLFHHVVEVEHPDWMVIWADAETMRTTRRWLLDRALAENALLIAAHIAAPGRIRQGNSGLRWVDA
jgi:glyoxylase-like metal-dependent hydrolase (beta-lactamase superfamily II)